MAKTDLEKVTEHLDKVNQVAQLYLEGKTQPEIANSLGISRNQVVSLLSDWREMAASNEAIHSRAREALAGADRHFSSLIKKAYDAEDEANMSGDIKSRLVAIKLIADIEGKRIAMLQNAGVLDNREIAEELARMEHKHEIIIGILKDIASKYPNIRTEIMTRLQAVTTEAIVVGA